MITKEQYFNGKQRTAEQEENAEVLLVRVRAFLYHKATQGNYKYQIDPDTGTTISGSKGGTGGGGFRLPDEAGAANSAHKQAQAVDVADAGDLLDNSITDEELAQFGLYREHPDDTPNWCHLTTRRPRSKRRTFKP